MLSSITRKATTTIFARSARALPSVQTHVQTQTQTQSRGYHDSIVEHYENPQNVGSLDKDDINVGTVRYVMLCYVNLCYFMLFCCVLICSVLLIECVGVGVWWYIGV